MGHLRTAAGEERYREHRRTLPEDAPCALCEERSIQEFTYWRTIPNIFPYDRIASLHHMLVPKRHCIERELNADELSELLDLKEEYCNEHYEHLIESTHHRRSIPAHFHIHAIVAS